MSVGSLLSGDPCPCKPCARCSSRLGLCWLPFSTFSRHPSWICGGERSPVRCGVVKSERQRGHSSPWELAAVPLLSFLGIALEEPLWLLLPLQLLGLPSGTLRPSWRETRGTLFCGCAALKKRQMPVSGIVHSCSSRCNVRLLCDSSRRGHSPPPCIGTEGAEGQLYQLVLQVDLQSLQAHGGVKLSK